MVSVSGRLKEASSLREKIRRKHYTDPARQVTDLCGLRVIAYLESDVDRIAALIRKEFAVDERASVDKRTELKPNQVGYRSLHLICHLGPERTALAEYERFAPHVFELQVRTVLQHAWAQIEWGRNYKFGGVLPDGLQRRLLLAAGALEILDREFSSIAAEVDSYAATPDEPINSLVLRTVAAEFSERTTGTWSPGTPAEYSLSESDLHRQIVDELNRFGINTRKELEELLSGDFVRSYSAAGVEMVNETGLFRDAMMWKDLDRYFTQAHAKSWQGIDAPALRLLTKKHEDEHIISVLTGAGVEATMEDDDDWTGLEELAEAITDDDPLLGV